MTEPDEASVEDAGSGGVPWRRIGRVIGLLVLLAVVVPFVVHAVPQAVGAEQSYVVLSGSMEPAMSPGDVIVVDSVGTAEIREGDVITFRRSGESTPTTHRVIEVVEREDGVAFRTKGDANEDPDAQLVTPDQVVGEVPTIGGYLFVIPYIGYVVQFMQTTTGFVALFVVPIALLIVSEIWNVVAASRRTEPTPSDTDDDAAADESSASTASDEVAGATSADGDSATETEADGLTFSALELQLGLAVLTAFLAYSLWVVYAAFEIFEAGVIWASGVAAAVAVAFLLFLGLYLSGRRGGDDPDRNEAVTAADGGESRASDSEREPTGEADPEEAGKFDWPSEAESGADAAGSVAGGEADE